MRYGDLNTVFWAVLFFFFFFLPSLLLHWFVWFELQALEAG